MFSAEQIECRVSSLNDFQEGLLHCTSNASNTIDIWVAFGTVSSAVVAVALGMWTVIDARIKARREKRNARQKRLVDAADPVFESLREIRKMDQRKLVEQSGSLYNSMVDFVRHVGEPRAIDREMGEVLSGATLMFNYAISEQLYLPDEAGQQRTLPYIWISGVTKMVDLLNKALIDYPYAEKDTRKSQCLQELQAKLKPWWEQYFPDGDYLRG